jgi:DNA-binding Lrp family transcriptional regulator
MDVIDREILSLLQEDGRMSATDVAGRVGLSLSSCHRRLKELEQSGAIQRYRAIIDPGSVGLGFEAIVFVTMAHTVPEVIAAFEEEAARIPAVAEAQRLFGEPDYMLRVLARDLAGYQELYDTTLSGLPGVLQLRSTLVMKKVGPDRTVPIYESS